MLLLKTKKITENYTKETEYFLDENHWKINIIKGGKRIYSVYSFKETCVLWPNKIRFPNVRKDKITLEFIEKILLLK